MEGDVKSPQPPPPGIIRINLKFGVSIITALFLPSQEDEQSDMKLQTF
jgi:hypothetical protein